MLRIGCLITFVLLAALSIAIIKFLPWWGALLAFAGIGVVMLMILPKAISKGIGRVGMALFETKSKVLRDAGINIHLIEWTDKPISAEFDEQDDDESEEEEEDERPEYNYLLVEATITPKPTGENAMQHYEPGEMLLVPFDKPIDATSLQNDNEDESIEAHPEQILFIDKQGNVTDEWDKVTGENRIRFIFAVPHLLTGKLKFQYYFEGLGDLTLPTKP